MGLWLGGLTSVVMKLKLPLVCLVLNVQAMVAMLGEGKEKKTEVDFKTLSFKKCKICNSVYSILYYLQLCGAGIYFCHLVK